jgi:hypothetical protein
VSSTFKDIKSALAAATKQIQKAVDASLLNEVTDGVRQVEQAHISEDVYERIFPKVYKRRYGSRGGIIADKNIVGHLTGNGELSVSNETPFNPYLNGEDSSVGMSDNSGEGLDGLINYGDGWNGLHYDIIPFGPTNFREHTIEELEATKYHVEKLKEGLIKRGFDCK